jgi:acetyltransferase-like isoleucine patch superfamily enzyme
MSYFLQQGFFVFRIRYYTRLKSYLRELYYTCLGMHVGKNTALPKLYVTWPHHVALGDNCLLEHNTYFNFNGIWSKGPGIIIGNNVFIGNHCEFNIKESITIGDNALIAAGCKFIDHDHGMAREELIRLQHGLQQPIVIGEDVWLGYNVTVLKGVNIGKGAVVAAGAVIVKSVPPYEVWAGIPAKKISERKQ